MNLNFVAAGRENNNRTQVWEIRSIHTDILAGYVKWYDMWNVYTLYPQGTMLDSSSLREIAKFLDEQMDFRKLNGDR